MLKYSLLLLVLSLPAWVNAQNASTPPPDTVYEHWHLKDKPEPTKKEVLLRITVFDLERRKIPDLEVRAVQTATGRVWQGVTGKYGEVYFRVPRGQEFQVGAGDEDNIETITVANDSYVRETLSITHLAKAFTEDVRNDTVWQKVSLAQTPTRERVLVLAKILDLDDQPLEGEVLYFSAEKSGKVFTATTNRTGRAAIMLPKGDNYCFSTVFYPRMKCYDIPNNPMAGQLSITFNTIGTRALQKRKAERERQAAIRDSLYREMRLRDSLDQLNRKNQEISFLHQMAFGTPIDTITQRLERRGAREREAVKQDPRFFEKSKEVVKATLYRMRERWKNKVIVTDLTGSMSPYMDQVLLWHALQLVQGEQNRYIFFNDGDHKADAEKIVGQTGGIYVTDRAEMEALLQTMLKTAEAGSGGDGPENDLEAVLLGAAKMQGLDELVLIADNYSDVRDMALLTQLKVPVHVVLCGTDLGVNENYLEIAYQTGGSIHTIEQDIDDLAQLADGATITIGRFQYRVCRGKFIQVTRI